MQAVTEVGMRLLLTYTLHSTVLLGLVWMIVRLLPKESNRASELLWRCALLGPLLTAGLQTFSAIEPLGGRLQWSVVQAGPQAEPQAPALSPKAQYPLPALEGEREFIGSMQGTPAPVANLPRAAQPIPSAKQASAPTTWNWQPWVLSLWALGGLVGCLVLLCAWHHLKNRMARRRLLESGELFDELAQLCQQNGIAHAPRLSVSPTLKSPATFGILRPQIGVPERALYGLAPQQRRAMLGHELAHVLRRDPIWFLLYRATERLFFFQPLNRVARRELQELAEYQCDDWAAGQVREPLELANCLTEVAGWLVREKPQVALLPMAGSDSELGLRVKRLLDEESRRESSRARPWAAPMALGLLASGIWMLPGMASAERAEGFPPEHIRDVFGMDPNPPTGSQANPSAEVSPQATDLGTQLENMARRIQEMEMKAAQFGTQAQFQEALTLMRAQVQDLRQKNEQLQILLAQIHAHQTPNTPKTTKTEEPFGPGVNQ